MALNSGLISYWNLDTNFNDDTPTGNNGSNSNVTISGGAAVFSTNGYVNLSQPANLSFQRTDSFTVAIECNPSAVNVNQQLFAKQQSSGNYVGYELGLTSMGAVRFVLAGANGNYAAINSNNSTMSTGSWQYIIFTYDGSSNTSGMNFYRNNSAMTKNVESNTLNDSILNAINVNIGNRNNNADSNYWRGSIKKVGVWNRVLTSDERTELWNGGTVLTFPFPSANSGNFFAVM